MCKSVYRVRVYSCFFGKYFRKNTYLYCFLVNISREKINVWDLFEGLHIARDYPSELFVGRKAISGRTVFLSYRIKDSFFLKLVTTRVTSNMTRTEETFEIDSTLEEKKL